jgi:hypothetical protein
MSLFARRFTSAEALLSMQEIMAANRIPRVRPTGPHIGKIVTRRDAPSAARAGGTAASRLHLK